MSGWDKAQEAAKKAGGGKYLSLKNDKDKAVVAFIGEPTPRSTTYIEGKGTVPFTEELKKKGAKERVTILFNVFDFSDSKVRVLEVNPMTFKDILKVREKYGLEKRKYEIERHGAKGDTKTTYSVLPDEELTKAEREAIADAELYDLDKEAGEGAGAGGDEEGDDGGLVDEKTRGAIIDRLKSLPREKADEFLKKFGIGKVKELPASKAKAALTFLSELEKAGAAASDDEEDPFA